MGRRKKKKKKLGKMSGPVLPVFLWLPSVLYSLPFLSFPSPTPTAAIVVDLKKLFFFSVSTKVHDSHNGVC